MRTGDDKLSMAFDGWDEAVAEVHRLDDLNKEMLAALKGVVRVADRKTVEFAAAHAAIRNAEGPSSEEECMGCGTEISSEREGKYCSDECFEKAPVGTGWSPTDKYE